LEEALTKSPQAYGFLSTVWTGRALGALLADRHGVEVYTAAVHRTLLAQGYRYRQPRHDLKHRQDRQAVAAARQVLEWFKKNYSSKLSLSLEGEVCDYGHPTHGGMSDGTQNPTSTPDHHPHPPSGAPALSSLRPRQVGGVSP